MKERTISDYLREEYFTLLPQINLVMAQLEAEVKYELISISEKLQSHQRFDVTTRVKDCESAINALRLRQEFSTFDKEKIEPYSLTELHDLAGVRVLVFPRELMNDVNKVILTRFHSWKSDPVKGYKDDDPELALKYYGHTSNNSEIIGEIQIVPMLTGLFWEVEHAAIYKPKLEYKSISRSFKMKQQTQEVLDSLKRFEETFESLIREAGRKE